MKKRAGVDYRNTDRKRGQGGTPDPVSERDITINPATPRKLECFQQAEGL
jgi:hypothetical protein